MVPYQVAGLAATATNAELGESLKDGRLVGSSYELERVSSVL